MDKLYDLEIDLSSNDGGVGRDQFKDWMRVRLHGHSVERRVSVPPLVGSVYFFNDGDGDVILKRGGAVPVRIERGQIVHVMMDGTASGMRRVGY